ncbi:MAG: hypothetical protein GTO12_08865 [Proteobacteria bacterium]|nr:hypothetical protein [Pseudomonadota bacterium]
MRGFPRAACIAKQTFPSASGIRNRNLKGVVMSADLARAVISMWFGSNPLDTSLKNPLLGKP